MIAQMGSYRVDVKTNETTWSKNLFRLYELPYSEEPNLYDSFMNMVHPEDRPLFGKILNEINETKKETGFEFRIIIPNGNTKWLKNNILPIYLEEDLVVLEGINIDITDKKLAEAKIKEQNERLNAIVTAMPDLMFVFDKYGNYKEYFTNTPEKLLAPEDKIIGLSLESLFDKQTSELHLQKISECLLQKSLITYEYHIKAVNGVDYYEERLVPLGSDQVLAFVRDITGKKLKEIEIKRLYLAIEQSPVSIVITDLNADIEYVNPAFLATTGYSYEEMIGNNPRILKSGKTDKAVYQDLWKTITSGKEWHGEWLDKKRSGELFWEKVSINPIVDEFGIITNYLAVKQDVTQQKQHEEEILNLNINLEHRINERTVQLSEINEILQAEIVERKKGEDNLKQISSRLALAVKAGGVGVWDYDIANDLLIWDDQMFELYGIKREDFSGAYEGWQHGLHPDDRERGNQEIQMAIDGEKDFDTEFRVSWPDSTIHIIRALAIVHRDDYGKPFHMIGTNWDITEQKLAEEALAIEKQRLASIIEGTNVGTWEWDIPADEIIFNERWARLIGYTIEEISPANKETWMKYAHPDDLAAANGLIEKHFRGESDYYAFESRIKHKDGRWLWMQDRGRVHKWGEDGKPIFMSGTRQDITERMLALDELEESRETHRGLSEAAFDSIFFSEKGVCIAQNQMAEKVFGYSTEEALGRYGTDWIVPEDRKNVMEKMLAGREEPYEVTALRKDGTTFPCMLSGKMMYYKGRNVRVTSLSDISARKLAEQALVSSEKRFSTFMDYLPALVFIKDFESKMIYSNNAINLALGASKMIGKSLFEIYDKEVAERIIADDQKTIQTGYQVIEESFTNLDGTLHQYETQKFVIPRTGQESLLGGIALDITDRKRSQEIKEQIRQNYETFFNTIDDFLFVLDETGCIIHTNNTVIRRLGYLTEELTGQSVLVVHPGPRREEAGRIVGEMLAGTADFCPVPLITKSGIQIGRAHV